MREKKEDRVKGKLTLGLGEPLPRDLQYFVDRAKEEAEHLPGLTGGNVHIDMCRDIVVRGNDSILVQRDRGHRDGIAEKLMDVMLEAAGLDYDITNPGLQRTLMNIATLMYTEGYQPMRVLGATGEAFKKM